jgi:uncharacterized protein (DUF58 family)
MDRVKEILRKIRRLELLTRHRVESAFAGQYHSVFKGRGMNFEEVREYEPGDEIRTIDWNVTARTGQPHVKRYTEERELTVMLVVDVSASGVFGSQDLSKRELAAEVAALLAFSAMQNNDKAGLILFSDRVEFYLPPRKGRSHALRLVREVLFFQPAHAGTRPEVALEFLNRVQSRRAVVFLLSDFMAPDFSKALSITARRHDLIAVPISDPLEREIPDLGLISFEDPETGREIEVNTSRRGLRRSFSELRKSEELRWQQIFARLRVDTIPLETGRDCIPPLRDFFRRRERRRNLE